MLDCRPGLAAVRRRTACRAAAPRPSTRRAATPRSTTRGCACRRPDAATPILVPPSGHVCGIYRAHRQRRAACTRRRPTRSSTARSASSARMSDDRPGPAQPAGHQRPPRLPGRRAADRSGARAPPRPTATGSTSTSAGCSSSSRSRSRRASAGRSSSRTTCRSGRSCKRTITDFLTARWRDGALFGANAGGGVLRADRRGAQPVLRAGARPAAHRDRRPRRPIRPSSSSSASASGRAASESAKANERRQPWPPDSAVDPYGNFNFLVEIDGITRAAFQRGQRPRLDDRRRSSTARAATTPRCASCPGMTKYSNIMLKWGMTDDRELYDWHRAVGQRRPGASARTARSSCSTGTGRRRRAGTSSTPGRRSGPARPQRRGQRRRDRDARARARRRRAGLRRRHVPDRIRVHAAVRLPRRGRHAAPRRRDAPGDRGRRDPAAARTRACRRTRPICRDPAVAGGHAARRRRADHAEGRSRGCSRPTSPTCRTSTTRSTGSTSAATVDVCPQCQHEFALEAPRAGGIVGYPLDQLHEEVAFSPITSTGRTTRSWRWSTRDRRRWVERDLGDQPRA